MRRRNDFLDFLTILLRGGGPSAWLVAAFGLGLLVVAPQTVLAVAWRPALAALALTGVAYLLYRRDNQGRPLPGTQRVVLVKTAFYITREP